MASDISTNLRGEIRNRADERCEYCLIVEKGQLYKHEVDHIIARQHDGKSVSENLALACWRCNRRKGTNLGSIDSETGDFTFFSIRAKMFGRNIF